MDPAPEPPGQPNPFTRWLERAGTPVLVGYAMAAAFLTYFCSYAFRKPFAAAEYTGQQFLGTSMDLKTVLMVSQIIGYTLAKYLGIKFCSEITGKYRCLALVLVILSAEAALLVFALVPADWRVAAIFFNGLPLGMVWGLIVLYLEGRRTSEVLLAGLSCSFILASGVVKDCGRFLMERGISEEWMPAVTGLCFLPLFLLSAVLLHQTPAPSASDRQERTPRQPMSARERLAFLRNFFPGLAALLAVYFVVTAYRDFRDNYGVEIFRELGFAGKPAIFTRTELPVTLGVMVVLASLNLIRNNRWALVGTFAVMIGGLGLMAVATMLFDLGMIRGDWWMIGIGLGIFMVYVPFASILSDQLMASTRTVGTAVFTIYLTDAIGYTGSVFIQLYRDLAQSNVPRLAFLHGLTYVVSIMGIVLLTGSCLFFLYKSARAGTPSPGQS